VHYPDDANKVHFEEQLLLVIRKRAKNVAKSDAQAPIFGVTIGNDLSERSWRRTRFIH